MQLCNAPGCNSPRYQSPKGKKYSHCTLHKSRMSRYGAYESPIEKEKSTKTQRDYYLKHKEKMDLIKRNLGFQVYCGYCGRSYVSSIPLVEFKESPKCSYC